MNQQDFPEDTPEKLIKRLSGIRRRVFVEEQWPEELKSHWDNNGLWVKWSDLERVLKSK